MKEVKTLDSGQIRDFLEILGNRHPEKIRFYLLGGSALCLLGSPRPTLDIDYVGDDLIKDDLQLLIESIGFEMHLNVDPVPIHRFLPVLQETEKRSQYYGTFGGIEVYIFDPYSIALSKIDRGFDTDLDDVVFLIRNNFIKLDDLVRFTLEILPHARVYDIVPEELLDHLGEVQKRLR